MKKKELRTHYLAKRGLLSEEEVSRQSLAIKDLLFSRLRIHRYDKIHCYLPVGANKEVDSSIFIQTLLEDFPVEVYVPKIHKGGILTHHKFEANTKTEPNKWGVPEPLSEGVSSDEFFDTDDDILVIVPLLAFDIKGNRVGYGKGYYDRFLALATENTLITGLSFFEAEEAIEDAEETDIPLHHAATPKRVYSF